MLRTLSGIKKQRCFERKAKALMLVVSLHPEVLAISCVIPNQGFTSIASVSASLHQTTIALW